MAAAVVVPMSAINLNGGVLPSSALTGHHSPRHGRSRGASISKGKGGRGRGYSLVDDRETTVSKAVVFVLKRAATVPEDDKDESDEDDDKILADANGWVDVDDVLSHPKLSALGVTLTELRDLVSSSTTSSKTRQLSLRQLPGSDPSDPASYEIRRSPQLPNQPQTQTGLQSPSPTWTKITPSTPDLPEFILHETSYAKYHLILTSGSIKRAGGQPFLSFAPLSEESPAPSTADVAIWIHLPSVLASHPKITWQRTDSGSIVTADEVPRALWKRAVARRGDLGVLYEDGEVRREVPFGLRGKGAKAKAKKGKGVLKSKGGEADDGSDSASASAEE